MFSHTLLEDSELLDTVLNQDFYLAIELDFLRQSQSTLQRKYMHIQIINFNLEGINRAEYEAVCNELAEAFAALPGLISKHWLADDENNTYGGVYIWESKDSYEAYLKSDLFAGVGANPALTNIVSKDFDVIEGPTRVTRGL